MGQGDEDGVALNASFVLRLPSTSLSVFCLSCDTTRLHDTILRAGPDSLTSYHCTAPWSQPFFPIICTNTNQQHQKSFSPIYKRNNHRGAQEP
jgi:hypothetical protein